MEDIEIPQYFLCPISLQIMQDPVTATTGITYDRDSIEQWLHNSPTTTAAVCPVSKQPLPRNADLTPNHTVRRLIQAWCTLNAQNGVVRIPTPKPPLTKPHVTKLLRDLPGSLHKLDAVASESDRNRATIADAGAAKAMISLVLDPDFRTSSGGIEQALRILNQVWNHTLEATTMLLVRQNEGPLLQSLSWILNNSNSEQNQTEVMCLTNRAIAFASASLLERLEPDFFRTVVVRILQANRRTACKQAVWSAALQILIEACPWGANRAKIVEADAVHALIELQLDQMSGKVPGSEKHATELAFDLLARLCSCADGRERLLGHAAGLAVVAKRTLRVSAATDDRAVQIMGMVARYAAGKEEVLAEMLRVGAVSKLCMVLQADCAAHLKEKARGILREHSKVWNNSPCIAVYLLTWYPR